jgi:3'-phosphoadenosine 5'-phosphosulfate sulfotransferase (PAPS reductase)/FAD synthetase
MRQSSLIPVTPTVGKKQHSQQADWLDLIAHIKSDAYDFEPIKELEAETVAAIAKTCRNKTVSFGWSGGKDSVALAEVCRRAGINECVFVMTNLEYLEFLEWVTSNMPPRLEVINTGQDLAWLVTHQKLLFPQDSHTAMQWFRPVQHEGQTDYFRKHKLDLLITGRRIEDGNFMGKNNMYTNRLGVTRYSPLANWTHIDLMAYLHLRGLKLPPCYRWPRGFQVGTGPWPARQWSGTVENGWWEVYQIDSSVVRQAADLIPSARAFMASDRRHDERYDIAKPLGFCGQ